MVSKIQYTNCAIEEGTLLSHFFCAVLHNTQCEWRKKRILTMVNYLDDKLILECTNALNAEPEDTEFKITSFSPQVDAFLFAPNQQYYYVGE